MVRFNSALSIRFMDRMVYAFIHAALSDFKIVSLEGLTISGASSWLNGSIPLWLFLPSTDDACLCTSVAHILDDNSGAEAAIQREITPVRTAYSH